MKWYHILGFIALLYSCENEFREEFKNEYISANGSLHSVELVESFHIDSVQFSSGETPYFIQGEVLIANELVSITLLYDGNPLRENLKLSRYMIVRSDLPWRFDELIITIEHHVLRMTGRNAKEILRVKTVISEEH